VFKDVGYNIIHIVPIETLSDTSFSFDNLTKFIDRSEGLGLWFMYDTRWSYQNFTLIAEQVAFINSRKSDLLYYTANGPEGQTELLNATKMV